MNSTILNNLCQLVGFRTSPGKIVDFISAPNHHIWGVPWVATPTSRGGHKKGAKQI